MVQIHGLSRRALLQESLGQSLGQGLANFTNTYFAGKALDKVLENPEYENAPMSKRTSMLEQAMRPYGEYGLQNLKTRIGIEQQVQQEQEQKVLSKIAQRKEVSEKELSKLSPENQFKAMQAQKRQKVGEQIKQNLINAKIPEQTAELWKNQFEATESLQGQADVIKQVDDILRRSKIGKGQFEEENKPQLKTSIEIPGIENKSYELEFPELKEMIGKTSADIIKEESENRKINSPLYGETIDSLNALDEDFRDIKQLQEYNEDPDALPTGAEKWNVDWDTGDLRFKALATPETQDYVKIIARLLGRAKEYFPGRVTNFDLAQFRQRFPTLANSPEGRRLIAKQLTLANRIAFLKDETLKAAIDHYGAGADPVQIRRYAQENHRRLKNELERELKELNSQSEEMMNPEEESNNEIPEGFIKVKFNNTEGIMPRNQYERAKQLGKHYELVE